MPVILECSNEGILLYDYRGGAYFESTSNATYFRDYKTRDVLKMNP